MLFFFYAQEKLSILSCVKWSLVMLNINCQTEESPPAQEQQTDPPLCRNHQTLWPEYSSQGRRKVKIVSTSLLLWAHLLVEQMQLVLKEKRGEVTGSIGNILTNTIDLSVMGLLRAVHALFSQKAESTQMEDQPQTRGGWDQTHHQRDVTTRAEWWENHGSHSGESSLKSKSE